jgi:peptide-methionine (S)-S-oxide reductase
MSAYIMKSYGVLSNHLVNSLSILCMSYLTPPLPTQLFSDFQKKFPNSINRAKVGFMSPFEKPRIKNPTYRDVCSGSSGHVEVLFVELNDPQKHFVELIRFFFQFHDPTTQNRQGNDSGFQYASYIFCDDEEQTNIAKIIRAELQAHVTNGKIHFGTKEVTTKIGPMMPFTEAEAAHQEYLEKNPNGYCNHRIRFKDWPARTIH